MGKPSLKDIGLAAAFPLVGPWAWAGSKLMPKAPKIPGVPEAAPAAPDASDIAIRNAKLMERRKQIGLSNRNATWLTGARGDTTPARVSTTTLLGG